MAGEKFLLLDGHSLAYRAFHALPPENFVTSTGQNTNAVYGFLSMLINVIKEQKPTHVAVAFDLSRTTFRSREYPEYKATRTASPPEFKGQVELIKQLLEGLNIPVVTYEDYEADDILATISHHVKIPVRILTGDRDSFQLIDDTTLILYPRKSINDLALMDDAAVQEKYGVSAKQYRDLAALVGETSDNLPGIPGVGPKTAAKWINEYGGIEEILAAREAIGGKVGEALRANVDNVERNYRLNKLVDSLEISTDINDYVHRAYNQQVVHELLDHLEFNQLRGRLFSVWPSGGDDVVVEEGHEDTAVDANEGFAVEARNVDAKALSAFLKATKDEVAIAFSGTWGRGTGELSLVALANSAGDVVWSRFDDVQDVVGTWLSSTAPKIVHDVKGPLNALGVAGIDVNNIAIDTAIAAYLVAPGTRNFDLPDLVQRYLRKDLSAVGGTDDSDMLFSDDTASGETLSIHARAMVDLADYFGKELAQRGSQELMATIELALLPVLSKMEIAGIAVDEKALKGLEASFEADAATAVAQAHKAAGHELRLATQQMPKHCKDFLKKCQTMNYSSHCCVIGKSASLNRL
jgi:DNA polymerase-1